MRFGLSLLLTAQETGAAKRSSGKQYGLAARDALQDEALGGQGFIGGLLHLSSLSGCALLAQGETVC